MKVFDRFPGLARPAAGAGLAVALCVPFVSASPAQAHEFSNDLISSQALATEIGSYGGQCKVFAQAVVNSVLKQRHIKHRVRGYGTPGGAYYGSYRRAGGVRVDLSDAQPGDLIQVITRRFKRSDSPPRRDDEGDSVLHTAIVVKLLAPGTFRVRDSNWHGDETVQEHKWKPRTWRRSGAAVYVWRFGKVPESASASAMLPPDSGAALARVLASPAFAAVWPLGLAPIPLGQAPAS